VTTESPYPSGSAAPTSGRLGTDTGDASVGQLMSEIASDLSTLMRQEIELAKAEVRQEAVKAGRGAGLLGGAAYAGHMVLLVGTFAIVFALGSWIGLGWAALIMTAVWAIVAAVLAVRGREQLRQVNPKPELTVQSVKEDVAWARHPTS
jgi:hypothetical protein